MIEKSDLKGSLTNNTVKIEPFHQLPEVEGLPKGNETSDTKLKKCKSLCKTATTKIRLSLTNVYLKFSPKTTNYQLPGKVLTCFLLCWFVWYWAYLYTTTLTPCTEKDGDCVKMIGDNIMSWSAKISFAAVSLNLIMFGIIKKILHRLYILPILSGLCYIYYVSYGWDWVDHGNYNLLFFVAIFTTSFCAMAISTIAYKFKGKFRMASVIITVIVVTYTYFSLQNFLAGSCDDWDKGLKNSRLSNDNNFCQLNVESGCFFNITDGWFGINRWQGDCSTKYGDPEEYAQYYKNMTFVGYPRSEYLSESQRSFPEFQKYTLNNLIPIESREDRVNKNVEVMMDMSSGKPTIDILVFRNESLVQRSIENEKNRKHQPISKNILMIYVDAISRPHFFRRLKKTVKWLEQYYQNKFSSHEAFQFFRYHSVESFGSSTMMPIDFCLSSNQANSAQETQMIQSIKDQGFVTGISRNFCSAQRWDYSPYLYRNLEFKSL